MKYSDSVTLVQRQSDGSITRTNALVLASAIQPKNASIHTGLKNQHGLLPEGEYLDLAFLTPMPDGQVLKTTSAENYTRPAHLVAPWKDGAVIGWEPKVAPPSPDAAKLRKFLFANFKSETGNETPEDCAIRLLSATLKKK
jgi:hypothetical protein